MGARGSAVEDAGDLQAALAPIHEELRKVSAQLEAVKRSLPPSLGSLRDAAKVLHCDPSTVYRAWKRGEISGRQIGGRIFIDLAALRPVSEDEAVEAAWGGRKPPRATE